MRSGRSLIQEPGWHWLYSESDGGMVLRVETSWRKVSGVVFVGARGTYWFYWRRSQLWR